MMVLQLLSCCYYAFKVSNESGYDFDESEETDPNLSFDVFAKARIQYYTSINPHFTQ